MDTIMIVLKVILLILFAYTIWEAVYFIFDFTKIKDDKYYGYSPKYKIFVYGSFIFFLVCVIIALAILLF